MQVKKIRKRERKTWLTSVVQFFRIYKNALIAVTGLILILTGLTVIAKKTLRSPIYTITYISFDKESLSVYDDPLLYRTIAEQFEARNYFVVRRFTMESLVTDIQQKFPLVEDIILQQQGDQQFLFTVLFSSPSVVFLVPDGRRYASLDEQLYLLGSGNSLGSNSIQLELPRYTANLRSIDGIFYEISEMQLVSAYVLVEETLGAQHIAERIYLPGGSKFFLAYKGKRLYIHLDKDINMQLQKLIDLENSYAGFDSLQTIDIGSSDDIIVK